MEKRQELYKGKAKTVYATDDPDLQQQVRRYEPNAALIPASHVV